MRYKCNYCNGHRLHEKHWLPINDELFDWGKDLKISASDEYWCMDCNDYTTIRHYIDPKTKTKDAKKEK